MDVVWVVLALVFSLWCETTYGELKVSELHGCFRKLRLFFPYILL